MPELALYRHGEELLRFALQARATVGRAAACDLCLPDPALSRVQAELAPRPGGWQLHDRSGRGTRVAGAVVEEATLSEGAEIALGGWRAVFHAGPPAEAHPTGAGAGATVLRPAPERPAAPAPPARLRVREGERDRWVPLEGDPLVVGKGPGAQVALEGPFVSAQHLRLERREGRWWARDLGSTNGTHLAGARLVEAELVPGARLLVGDAELWIEPAALPVEAAAAFQGMITRDPAMRQVFELLARVAPSPAPVTILGETGTGKELVARALHRLSGRQGAFIPVNCSAIAESLVESELFGHERGAFSGAERTRKGAFEEAEDGTLFLDEVGELPLELQPKLLRALELGEVKRVGASRPMGVDARIVAATHRDLRAQVRAGKFREDLFYRLCVVPVAIPPLRARRCDVRPLAEHFLERTAPRGLPLTFAEEALARLEAHDWPGNVRQLRNVVQRAVLLRGEGLTVPAAAVTFDDGGGPRAPGAGDEDTLYVRGLTLEDLEREAIRLALRRNHGRRSAVVRELGIAKSTVMKRIQQWGLQDEGREGVPVAAEDDES